MKATFGYQTKRDLPAREGSAKLCVRCHLWFLAGPYGRVCDGCKTNFERTKAITRGASKLLENAQVSGIVSEALGVTFKPGVPLWRILALEEAAKVDRGAPWPTMRQESL